MCGIVGMSFRRDAPWRENEMEKIRSAFTKMLVAAQRRGSSATGVILVSREKANSVPQVNVLRAPVAAEDLVEDSRYETLMQKLNNHSLSIVGHTRAVTGDAPAENNANNHPHIHGSVLSVHNGMVSNHRQIWHRFASEMRPKSRCDSEVIPALINHKLERGSLTTEAISDTIRIIEGWFALAIINAKEPDKIYVVRDHNTPLEIAWVPYSELALFASEWGYIEKAHGNGKLTGTLRRHKLLPMQLTALNSSVRGDAADFMIETNKIGGISSQRQAKILDKYRDEFETTQGKNETPVVQTIKWSEV